jgi:hypothetical protein
MRTHQIAFITSLSIGVAACSSVPQSSRQPIPAKTATSPATAAAPSTFSWPGVYDLVGSGFPEGDRNVVMQIEKADTSYTLVSLQGPPGNATIFQVVGDRARIVWNLGQDLMYVDLRGSRDSVTGEWYIGDESGSLRGARRR